MRQFLPLIDQLQGYGRGQLRGDVAAGVTVGVMLIPQGMAYALIAGLPPIYGLYASLVPLVIYAVFGTSRQLAVGPVAMVSLLVAAGVAPLANGDVQVYIGLALLLALMVGVLQFGLGVARFGFLTNFLSHPVLAGFTSAAALIIGFSQLKHLLGLDLARSNYVHEIVWQAIQQVEAIHPATLLIGVLAVVVLLAVRRWAPAVPGALAVVVLGTLVVWLLGLAEVGVAIVGTVPSGLPAPVLPPLDGASVQALMPTALTIALVGFMESIAVAKVYAARHRYEVDANQELIGLGLANIAGAFFQAYPTTGGFSRTAVNDQTGAQTNVAALVSAAIIALTLLLLTPLFHFLPKAVLAAIVMVAVFKLIDWKEARFLWKTDRQDLALMALTFAATLALGIEEGILVGIIASLVVVIYQASQPHTAVMGRVPGTTTYRNLAHHPDGLTQCGVVIFRLDSALFFANVAHFKAQLRDLTRKDPALHTLVLDFYPVNGIDSTGLHALKAIVQGCERRDIRVLFAGVKGPVRDRLAKAGLVDVLGPDRFFLEVKDAVASLEPTPPHAAQPAASEAVPV